MPLLRADEPPAFVVHRERGASSAFITCDHASARIPRALEDLGLPEDVRRDHVGWDIGAADLARAMSTTLDATLVESGYSRLVIDANRPLDVTSSIPEVTCGVAVPGNRGLGAGARTARAEACFHPYHEAVTALLDERASKRPTVLLAMHSFTPIMQGVARPWHVGVMYGRDRRLASLFLDVLSAEDDLVVGDNQPYQVTDGTDYTIPHHGERRGILSVLIEVRNDLLRDDASVARMSRILTRAYARVEERLTF